MDSNETHSKIIEAIKIKGPSLPIQLAKQINMSSLFVSAFLSEMVNEKKIKVSHLKVGGSPLYYLEKQEEQLEPYHKYMHPKESEAFLLLKNAKVLKDSEQDPAIRVALRSIRDFSMGFKKDDEIFWRFYSVSEQEVENMFKPDSPKKEPIKEQPAKEQIKEQPAKEQIKEQPAKEQIKEQITPKEPVIATKPSPKQIEKPKPKEKSKSEPKQAIKENPKSEFENPLIVEEKPKPKEKSKSEFVEKTIRFMNSNNLKIIEEKDYKTKEYNCISQIKSQLGPINFLTQAKEKKSISELDLKTLLSASQRIPLPAFFIHTGKLSKKAEEYAKEYKSILKVLKMP